MALKSNKIKIISKLSPEFSNNITIDNITYHALTEDLGIKAGVIITNIYLKGEIVFSKKFPYSQLAKNKNFKDEIMAVMEKQHKAAVDKFISDQFKKRKLKSDYFNEVKDFLRIGKGEAALATLKDALDRFPMDPFLLSYYGCLVAIVGNNPQRGIKICRDALARLGEDVPFGHELLYPVFYLNLGRAYLKGGRKTDAIMVFNKGLKTDPQNSDLLGELKKLGTRKRLPLPLLKRSNTVNKYIGKLLSRLSK